MIRSLRLHRNTTLLSVLVLVFGHLCLVPAAHADELEEFEEAREAYLDADYERAIDRFETLVGGDEPRLRSRPLILESRKYLAAAYLFAGRPEEAEAQLERLLQEDPTYQLDPVAFPREVHQLFGSVRERVLEERERQRRQREQRIQTELDQQQELEHQRARIEELEAMARTETVRVEHSRWIATIPFGVGQFQNGHDRLGLALAISEGVLAATSFATFFLHRAVVQTDQGVLQGVSPSDRVTLVRRERAYRYTNWTSTALLLGLVTYGIVDAHLRFVPYEERTRERQAPSGVQVGVGPGSLSLRVSF